MKTYVNLKKIERKLKEYQQAELFGKQKIINLQTQLSKTNTQLANIQGAVAALEDLLPENNLQEVKCGTKKE